MLPFFLSLMEIFLSLFHVFREHALTDGELQVENVFTALGNSYAV